MTHTYARAHTHTHTHTHTHLTRTLTNMRTFACARAHTHTRETYTHTKLPAHALCGRRRSAWNVYEFVVIVTSLIAIAMFSLRQAFGSAVVRQLGDDKSE